MLPGALVYAVSVQFLGKSIESWFDVRVDRALEGGLNLGRGALDFLLRETTNKASQIALVVSEPGPGSITGAPHPRGGAGRARTKRHSSPSAGGGARGRRRRRRAPRRPSRPAAQALRRARLQQTTSGIEQASDGRLLLRVVTPVNSEDSLEPLKVLQVVEPVPKSLAQDVEKVQAGSRDYQEIAFTRGSLKRLYAITLTLTLLARAHDARSDSRSCSPSGSRRRSGLLAEGTRAVAQGDFSRRQPVTSRDELGVLTESFNTMTAQLADAREKTEESRRATETTRAYLESILGNLSAGVLAFDDGHRLRTANASAAVILQQPLADLYGLPLAEWGGRLPALAPFAALVGRGLPRRAAKGSGSGRRS